MTRAAAYFFSVVFHPLLMPTLGVIILFTSVEAYFISMLPDKAKWAITFIVFLNTFVFPAGFIAVMLKTGRLSDPQVSNRKERLLPLIVTLVFYAATYFVMYNLGLHRVLLSFMLAAVSGLIAAFCINFFWKISMHMVGAGGLLGSFYAMALILNVDLNYTLAAGIIAAGIIASSRMFLKQHNLLQILAGAVVGFTAGFTALYLGV